MKYMIMLFGSQQDYDVFAGKPTAKPAMTPEELKEVHELMTSIHEDLAASGELVAANGLSAPVHARRVHLKDGVPAITDGPYAETAEVLAGYTIVECDSYDRAVEIAARFINPAADGEYVDIRPVIEDVSELEV